MLSDVVAQTESLTFSFARPLGRQSDVLAGRASTRRDEGCYLMGRAGISREVFEAIAEVLLKYRNNVMQLKGRSWTFFVSRRHNALLLSASALRQLKYSIPLAVHVHY